MKKLIFIAIALVYFGNAFSQFVDSETPENSKPNNPAVEGLGWELEFSDEFNGTEVNTSKWRIDNSTKSRAARPSIGIYDWRWKPENVSVGGGNLILKVYKSGTNAMTNGSINSYTKYETKYGYFETRIKIGEADKGTHTAFWLQGPNMSNVDGTANDGAEIDVFESAWTGEYTKSVVHIDGYGADHQANTKQYSTPGIHSGFHTWGFHWTEYFMDIYYDGVFKVRYSDPKWVVQSPEFLWLSNGASFGLSGDQYFLDYPIGFLTQTEVDYIRVWKDTSSYAKADTLLDQANWELVNVDSEDTYGENLAVNAFDGNPYTFWHTEWKDNQPPQPHEIIIDLGDTAKFYAFHYLPRQDNNPNGNIKDYEFYASNNSKIWGDAVKTGSIASEGEEITVLLDDTVSARYVKLVSLSEVNGLNVSNMAEFNLSGYYSDEGITSLKNINRRKQNSIYDIFPNPSSGSAIHIRSNTSFNVQAEVSVFDMSGTLIANQNISQQNATIQFNKTLMAGIYLLQIIDNYGTVETKRMIIEN